MSKKIKILLALISLSLTLGLMSNTYSRYVADTNGDLKMLFTKWQILVNDTDITENKSSSIVLAPVMEENSNIASNTVAPSSKGYFDIDIDPSNAGTSFDYNVSLDILNENMPDLMITKYALLDEDYNLGDEIKTNKLQESSIKGSVQYSEGTTLKPFTVRVFFEWYEGEDESMDDEADTEVGATAAKEDTELQIRATINFEQKVL